MYNKALQKHESIKKLFDRRTKASNFKIGDKVLKWDLRREDKGKHGNFDNLWLGPYSIHSAAGNNAFFFTGVGWSRIVWGSCQWQDA